MHKQIVWGLALLVMASACGSEQAIEANAPTSTEALNQASFAWFDSAYVKRALAFALFEQESARMATARTASPLVRDLSKRTLTIAGQQVEALQMLSRTSGIHVEPHLAAGDRYQLSRMRNLHGAEFDTQYLLYQKLDLADAWERSKHVAKVAENDGVRAYAKSLVCELRRTLTLTRLVTKLRGTIYDKDDELAHMESELPSCGNDADGGGE